MIARGRICQKDVRACVLLLGDVYPELTPVNLTEALREYDPAGQDEPELLTVREVCERFRAHRTTVMRWIAQGRLGSRKVGSKRLITRDSVREFEMAGERHS